MINLKLPILIKVGEYQQFRVIKNALNTISSGHVNFMSVEDEFHGDWLAVFYDQDIGQPNPDQIEAMLKEGPELV